MTGFSPLGTASPWVGIHGVGGVEMYKLRELERRDLSTINKWRNDPELISLLGAPFRFINLDVDDRWFSDYMANRGRAVRCAIVEANSSDKILGLVSLTDIDFLNQSAQFHIMIGKTNSRNKGIGTFAVNAMLSHAFRNMNIYRVWLETVIYNDAAQHLYEKCGFVKEGIKRKSVFKDGMFRDKVVYSILKEEFDLQKWGGVGDKFDFMSHTDYCWRYVA